MAPSSLAFRSFSSRWSWMTLAKIDGVSTCIEAPGVGVRCWGEIVALRAAFSTETAGGLRVRDGLARRLDPVLAGPFCLVHGRIGRREELGGGLRWGDRGDPEAGRDGDRGAVDGEDGPAGEGHPDPLGELGPARDVSARQDEDELLPAPAPSEVDVPDGLLEKDGELTQDCVACGMTVAVVDVLEPVEVGHDDCQGAAETFD